MSLDKLGKVKWMKPESSLEIAKNIMNGISDPLMVFKPDNRKDAFVILTEFTVKDENDVIVAIHLEKKEKWSEFYRSLGKKEEGRWFPKTPEGEYIFETSDKLIYTDGEYVNPKISKIVVFSGMEADDIEYGKELIWNAAARGKSSEECCEIARTMLGYGDVTERTFGNDKTYRRGKEHSRKRGSGRDDNKGNRKEDVNDVRGAGFPKKRVESSENLKKKYSLKIGVMGKNLINTYKSK